MVASGGPLVMRPGCKVFIVMGKTDPTAQRHAQQSMIIVPRDTPRVEIVRPLQVLGRQILLRGMQRLN